MTLPTLAWKSGERPDGGGGDGDGDGGTSSGVGDGPALV